MQPCRLLPHPRDDRRSFMESSQPPFLFDQQGLVALYLCSPGIPARPARSASGLSGIPLGALFPSALRGPPARAMRERRG
jgi:hypothetical protein